ncbi:MAG TPA: NAD(P)/FAD-dependent oxidoreductase [Verrucomicrobiae bacterium]|nr:NAD(P)/FAD-dependent oxidoreductase [Verrucomicrobiae bacterium]
MNSRRIVIVGGGAAGFFAALACAEESPGAEIILLEKTAHILAKVKISGGGRCNVTHACFDAREFATRYPRGQRALIAPFQQFQAADTVAWFVAHGVQLKTESDGRMFPVTDSSQTIVDCLLDAARRAGVKLRPNCGVDQVVKNAGGEFDLTLSSGEHLACDRLLLATGGCRTPALGQLAASLGHSLESPVPSLFTFCIEEPWLRALAGVSLGDVEATVAECKLRERGPLLVTHWGLSGPVILRLSAWGARALAGKNYRFIVRINWLPQLNEDKIAAEFQRRREAQGARLVLNSPIAPLSSRLWEKLVLAADIPEGIRWSALPRPAQLRLIQQLLRTEFSVTGKSLNKDEFVTCGGVKLGEVNFKTMESRVCPGLFFAGELLDIDGITGGFNFQAAWTTGWIAGKSMAYPQGVGS